MQSKSNFLNKIFFIEICYFYSYIALISYRVYLKFMSISINYKNVYSKKIPNIILFVDEKFNISSLKKRISSSEYSYISDLIKFQDLSKQILSFDISSTKKIILVSLKKNIKSSDLDEMVARLHLDKIGAKLTKLTKEQADYINVSVEGPYKPELYRY